MLLIFGTRYRETLINVVTFVCGFCGVGAAQNVVRRQNRFTLFFLPLFTVSTRYLNECTNCGGETRLSAQQANNSLEWSRRTGGANAAG